MSEAESDQSKELQFVHVSGPSEGKTAKTMKSVRSHVARAAHFKARQRRILEHRQKERVKGLEICKCLNQNSPLRPNAAGTPSVVCQICGGSTYVSTGLLPGPAGPSTSLGSGRVDPFASYALQLTDFEHELVDHYVSVVLPNSAIYNPPISNTDIGQYLHVMKSQLVSFTITDPGMLKGIFLFASRSLGSLHNEDKGLYSTNALRYKGDCIRSLKGSIEKEIHERKVSDRTIVQVLFLAADEFHYGNMESTISHVKAIGDLVNMKGGLQKLGLEGLLEQLVVWSERTAALYTEMGPNLVDNATGPEPGVTGPLSTGFRGTLDASVYSLDILSVFNDICAVTTAVNADKDKFRQPEIIASMIKDTGLDVKLLGLVSGSRSGSRHGGHSRMEECLCFALIIYTSKVLDGFRNFKFKETPPMLRGDYVATRIGAVFPKIIDVSQVGEGASDLSLWMVFMAALAVKETLLVSTKTANDSPRSSLSHEETTSPAVQQMWIIRTCRQLCEALEVQDLQDLIMHLKTVLWIESSCGDLAADLWKKVKPNVALAE